LVYTSIVVLPLLIIVLIISFNLKRQQYAELSHYSLSSAEKNASVIQKHLETCDRIESMVNADGELILFFARPQSYSEENVIQIMKEESLSVERLLYVMPEIYSIRIFASALSIPERWPVFLNARRTNLNILNNWEYNYSATYMGNADALKDLSVCTTRKLYKNRAHVGFLQVSLRMEDFFPFLYNKSEKYESDYVVSLAPELKSSDDIRCVSNQKIENLQRPLSEYAKKKIFSNLFNDVISSDDKNVSGSMTFHENHFDQFVSYKVLPEVNLAVIHISSGQSINTIIVMIYICLALVLLLLCVVLFFVIRNVTRYLMSGIYTLMNGMKEVNKGNFNVQLVVTRNDEVGIAQETFNSMTRQINQQILQIKQEQGLIADTEMKAMQNQINAHFLYNVLETIRMQAVLADKDDIAESIQVLGTMMRYCLRWRIHRVPLKQEIEYIRSYVYILNLRNDYKISLITEIPEEYENVEIPKMTLQPLIENAFTHAIEPLGQDAKINVSAEIAPDGKRLHLCVQDFGPGIEEKRLTEMRRYLFDDSLERSSTGSIGLKNIQQRLTMFYGKDYRLEIISVENKGTLVSVPIPLTSEVKE